MSDPRRKYFNDGQIEAMDAGLCHYCSTVHDPNTTLCNHNPSFAEFQASATPDMADFAQFRHLRNENIGLAADLSAALAIIRKMQEQRDSMPKRVAALPWGLWAIELGVGNIDHIKNEVLNCCAAEVTNG